MGTPEEGAPPERGGKSSGTFGRVLGGERIKRRKGGGYVFYKKLENGDK